MDQLPDIHDIDSEAGFGLCQSRLAAAGTTNFAIQFNSQEAHCGLNLSSHSIDRILEARSTENGPQKALWLNHWGWGVENCDIIAVIARHYRVSPRLAQMLCPRTHNVSGTTPPLDQIPAAPSDQSSDVEKATSTSSVSMPNPPKQRLLNSIADVTNNLWHFCTIDFGRRYICIGWNALFFLPDPPSRADPSKPNAIRIWSSLLYCDDGTIISVFESPPGLSAELCKKIRLNQINVFRHLSNHYLQHTPTHPLMHVTVRPDSSTNPSGDTSRLMASLMFYYLFDDWLNIYAQLAGGEHSYRHKLEQLREKMADSAEVEQVNTLHQLGRQLITLKSIYRSYEAVIDRVVQRHRMQGAQRQTQDWNRSRELLRQSTSHSDHTYHTNADDDTSTFATNTTNVHLAPDAITRFERLLDRIEICALTEVTECLNEKESLVLMNFNLVALKESQAVEKLTRTTILLAKVTILFLPVSLVTGYFSMQLVEIDQIYSLRTYWLSFLVVVLVTAAFLLGFGVVSERYKGKVVYKSLVRTMFDRRVSSG